jgi:hypothetical protein
MPPHRQAVTVVRYFIHAIYALKKSFFIVYFCLALFLNPVTGQIIEDRKHNDFDTLLLSPECKLDKRQLGGIFEKLEIYAAFPGGSQKWFDFAKKYFDFAFVSRSLVDTSSLFQDSIVVKFIVARNGTVCNIQLMAGNPILIMPATKLLKSSPNWEPGINGGRQLNSYRTLRIDILIDRKRKINDIMRFDNSYFRANN